LGGLYDNFGLLYSNKNAYTEAEKYYLKALEIYDNLNIENFEENVPGYVKALTSFANNLILQEKTQDATKYADKIKIISAQFPQFFDVLKLNSLAENLILESRKKLLDLPQDPDNFIENSA
jgi:tetratricopeptide (TPR) repeat protein